MFIRSERLFLRPGWPEDFTELQPLIDDPAAPTGLAQIGWRASSTGTNGSVAGAADPRCPQFLVTLPTFRGSKIIGCAGLFRSGTVVELGCLIARQHWGQGFGTETARALLPLACTLGHRRIVAFAPADTPASVRVLAKVGFRPTGEVRQRGGADGETKRSVLVHQLDFGDADDERGMLAA